MFSSPLCCYGVMQVVLQVTVRLLTFCSTWTLNSGRSITATVGLCVHLCVCLCSVYQRAVAACGLDYRSDRLWNQYVDWEQMSGEMKSVLPIYDQMLATPSQSLSLNFEK